MQEWLLDPSAHRADTAMPALLTGPNAEQDAADWRMGGLDGFRNAASHPGRPEDGKVLAAIAMPELSRARTEDDYDGISLAG